MFEIPSPVSQHPSRVQVRTQTRVRESLAVCSPEGPPGTLPLCMCPEGLLGFRPCEVLR